MAIAFFLQLDGVTQEQYDAVMGNLDLKGPSNPDGSDDWPDGVIAHYAGPTPGGWGVVDVWESQAHFDTFLADRLGPAMAAAGVPEPIVTPFELYNSHT